MRFALRLAIATGWTLEYILGLPSAAFSVLQAFERLEPFGPLQDDHRAGMVAATIFNVNRGEKTPAVGSGEFFGSVRMYIDDHKPPEPPLPDLTPEQEIAVLDAFFGFK